MRTIWRKEERIFDDACSKFLVLKCAGSKLLYSLKGWMKDKTVRNHVKLGVSPRVLNCVVDTGYGLGRSLGDCRPALPKGRKYQMVKTQTESHVRRPIV